MLSVEVGDTPEELVEALASALARPLDDPFAPEWVSVPSFGFRSWLRLRLAERLGAGGSGAGVVANVEMPFPSSLRWKVLEAHARHEGRELGDADPWHVDRLVWTVMDVMADPSADIHDRLRREHLPAGVTLAGRAGPIADLFDRYGVHRPEMLRAWATGDDVGPDGSPLDADHLWQPGLYREVRARIAARHGDVAPPADRLVDALEAVATGALPLTEDDLPPRLFVVGQSMLTAELGPVLRAVAHQREVAALLLSPSATTSARLAAAVAGAPPVAPRTSSWAFPRAAVDPGLEPAHPLLARWGGRPLESALLLGAGGVVPRSLTTEGGRAADGPAPRRSTLLQRIQGDLRAGRRPDAEPWTGTTTDGSVQVHAASGRTRQVEVLRDAVLGLLRDIPDLREADVAVLCPQLDLYGPVISAVLGPPAALGERPAKDRVPSLRYTVVDRDARAFNPVLAAMAAVVDALPGRFDAGVVRDLLHAPAVRERFGLTDDDLGLLSHVIEGAQVRWGIDGPHRRPWGIDPGHRANSWMAGIDQLLVGVALGDDLRDVPVPGSGDDPGDGAEHALAVGDVAPLPLDEGAIAGAGRLAAALRTLAHVHDLFHPGARDPAVRSAGPPHRPVADWCTLLRRAADLLVAPARGEDWQRARFEDALSELAASSTDGDGCAAATPLGLGDVRRLLSPALEGMRARADLGFGSIVVARPSLLAGIPFRVVCLLGLDDEALPVGTALGDDLMAHAEAVGDRDARGEARADVLTALGAARDAFVVTCTSRDVRTNAKVPRSVLLDELLEVVARTVGGAKEAEGIVTTHPRQAFDPRCFRRDDGQDPTSFDHTAHSGALALRARRRRRGAVPAGTSLVAEPLPPAPGRGQPLDLASLIGFYRHPVRSFLRDRLGAALPEATEVGSTELPTSLSALEASDLGRDLLLAGLSLPSPDDLRIERGGSLPPTVEAIVAAHRARGVLPPASVADGLVAGLADDLADLLAEADRAGARRPTTGVREVDLELPGGVRLTGRVVDCLDGDEPGPVRIRYVRPKPHQRVALALEVLALTAQHPEVPWRGVLVTRKGKGTGAGSVTHRVVGVTPDERRESALVALSELVAQRADGLRAPLPLFDRTSEALQHGGRPDDVWGDPFDRERAWRHESADPHHQLAFGLLTYEELTDLDAAGHTLAGEADRLWGTLDDTLEPLPEEDGA